MQPFRRNKQTGSIGDVIFGIVFLVVALSFAHGSLTADPQAVQELAHSARNSPEALATIKATLEKTPTPTNRELRQLRDKVNDQILLQTSKEVTGNPDLKAAPQVQTQEQKIETEKPQGMFDLDLYGYLIRIAGLLVFTWISWHVFRATQGRNDGR